MIVPAAPAILGVAVDDERSFAVRLMEHLVVATFVLDRDRRVIVWNKACERLTGVKASDVLGTSDHWQAFYTERRPCLADLIADKDYNKIRSLYAHCNEFSFSDVGVSVESECAMPKLGESLYLAIDAGPIYDDTGSLIAVVETLRDITAQHAAQTELESLASTDGLTGLANRRSFDKTLAAELQRAAREKSILSLLLVDVDHFKAFNDRYGHPAGDAALRSVAEAIDGVLGRGGDQAARYGGEEFAVILPATDERGARHVAEQIRRRAGSLKLHALGLTGPTVSIGITTSIEPASGTDGLIKAADDALYRAKREGRDRCIFEPTDEAIIFF